MGFLSGLLGVIGFGIGLPIGLLLGYFLFLRPGGPGSGYFEVGTARPLHELDASSLLHVLPEIPMWVKHPDYDRVDWFNKFVYELWPYLDKAICGVIRSLANPIFEEYSGKILIESIGFKNLSLGTLPPVIHGIKVHGTNEKELVFEPAVRWAGNPNITVLLKFMSLPVTIQLVDVNISVATRITLKPLVPTFPCFAGIAISLLEKPQVDFGLKLLRADIMSIPLLYHYVQEQIGKQVASLYLWPQTLDVQILDGLVGGMKKPVGILHVKVVRALKLLKMDILGPSDPYVQLSLSGERLPAKKTSIKMKNLNPEWNEDFKLTVKDPQSQVLQLHVYDWEKVGTHDKLGMQVIPLQLLTPYETKEFSLDLVKNTNPNDPHNRKHRGQLVVEVTFNPFKKDCERFSGPLLNVYGRNESGVKQLTHDGDIALCKGGLLLVTVQGAEDVEGKHHNNPFAVILFRGEQKKTKVLKKTRDPSWNEEFQFVLEEPPLQETIHIEVMSKRSGISFRTKETLGYVDINLNDVVCNGRINDKYNLINSRNGVIAVDIQWKVI